MCDPDNLLHDLQSLEMRARALEVESHHACGHTTSGTQFVVAVMTKMDNGVTSEQFATSLHDRWGVGHVPVC